MDRDHVDHITQQWAEQRPELDTRSLRISARLVRLQRFLDQRIAAVLDAYDLTEGEINVLATLRRAGPPFELTPTELYRGLLLSSSAMTNRLDRLEAVGLVRRIPDEADRRRVRVALTDRGREIVDEAIDTHVRELDEVLGVLDDHEHADLERVLRRLLLHLESGASDASEGASGGSGTSGMTP